MPAWSEDLKDHPPRDVDWGDENGKRRDVSKNPVVSFLFGAMLLGFVVWLVVAAAAAFAHALWLIAVWGWNLVG